MTNLKLGLARVLGGVVAFGLTQSFTRLVAPVMNPVFIVLDRAVVAAAVAILLLAVMQFSPSW